jgi:hypothetical protein
MFLEVITRTFGQRPAMLARNQASLAALTDPDWAQTLVIDAQARGCAWANANLATVATQGEYVWVLDDDDVCARPSLVAELKRAAQEGPDVIMLRAEHALFGTLPHAENWRQAPVCGDIGFSNFVIRGDIWNQVRSLFRDWECYEADFRLIDHLWRQFLTTVSWLDVVAACYPQRSLGAPEDAR